MSKLNLLGPTAQAALSQYLAEAIAKRQAVAIGYKNEIRLIEPHALGYNGKVRAYQLFPEKGWRLFDLAKMGAPTFEAEWLYKRNDKDLIVDGIIAQL